MAAIWREIMSACLALRIAPACRRAGPEGTFCEQAAIEFFGGAADLMYCANFDESFTPPPRAAPSTAWWARENSTEGVVTRSLDLFLHTPPCGGRGEPAGAPQPAARQSILWTNISGVGAPCRRWPNARHG